MSRLLRLCQHLMIIGCWQLVVASLALAQPTLISERKSVPRFPGLDVNIRKSFELPGRRFVHCGDAYISAQINGKRELTLAVSTLVGDTVRYRRLNRNPVWGGDFFVDAVLEPDYSLTCLSQHLNPPGPGGAVTSEYSLTQLDTLGAVRWQRFYPLYPLGTVLSANALLRVPDGYLVLVNPVAAAASTPTATYSQGGVAKFDRQGNLLWQRAWPSPGAAAH